MKHCRIWIGSEIVNGLGTTAVFLSNGVLVKKVTAKFMESVK